MEPFELELKEALNRRTPLPSADLSRLTGRITREYAQKQRTAGRLTLVYLGVDVLVMVLLFWLYLDSTDPKLSLLYGIGILITFEGTVLMKLWFWVLHGKIATIRELKLLQLLIAERLPPPPDAPPQPDEPTGEDAAGYSAAKAEGAGKTWRAVAIAVWALSLGGLLYCYWPQAEPGLKNASLYYEKTVPAADVTQQEQIDAFEVQQPRQRFHVRLVPATGRTDIRIALGREGGDAFFRGPLDDLSRIYFGRDLTPGRYWISTQGAKADAGYTLRVYGVDGSPSNPQPRTLLTMICSALVVALPLLWAQKRWLKRVDPEFVR